MSREVVNLICAEFPGAELSDPWGGGHDAWTVGGEMFAVVGARNEAVAVKTAGADEAEMLIAAGVGRRAADLHRSWVELPFGVPEAELRHRIGTSYHLVRKALPREAQARLDQTSG